MIQTFYKDTTFTVYLIPDNQVGNYYLTIPNNLMKNFEIFYKLKKEDNTKKGISETNNENNIRKQLLEDIIKANELFQSLNKGYVFSKNIPLQVLPVNELNSIINGQFDIEKYKIVINRIEDIINNNYRTMMNPNLRNDSINQVLMIINQTETDKKFVEWLKNNLARFTNQDMNINILKTKYIKDSIKISIEDYKEATTINQKYIIGPASNNEYFTIKIPNNFNINMLFNLEKNNIDLNTIYNKDIKQVAKILFDNMIKHYPSEQMQQVNNIRPNANVKNEYIQDQVMLNNAKEDINLGKDVLIDSKNNITMNTKSEIDIVEEQVDKIVSYNPEVVGNNYIEENSVDPIKEDFNDLENNIPIVEQSKSKVRVLTKPAYNSSNKGFIKISTIILFSLSFILITLSAILLIMS